MSKALHFLIIYLLLFAFTLPVKADIAKMHVEVTTENKRLTKESISYDGSTSNTATSALEPAASSSVLGVKQTTSTTTRYSHVSGNWEDPITWTTDPSGALSTNPGVPAPGDNVVILNGKSVTVTTNSKAVNTLTIDGILVLGNTTGHSATTIAGSGRIRTRGDNYPTVTNNHFANAGTGGTVEVNGTSFTFGTNRTFNNLQVNLESADQTLVVASNLTLNGNLVIEGGKFQIGDNSSTIRTITVNGNVTVNGGTSIGVGTGNTVPGTFPAGGQYHSIFHQFEIRGNFTNNGEVRFSNLSAPLYNAFTTSGAVTVLFTGATNNRVVLNNRTDFYNLIVNKGSDKTYELEINPSSVNNFALYGRNNIGRNTDSPFSAANPEVRKALWIRNGTLKFIGNVLIPTLTEGGTNGDFTIGATARLWLSSPGVTIFATASDASQSPGSTGINTATTEQALSVYGTLLVSSGTLNTRNSSGLIYYSDAAAEFIVEGGELNVSQLRRSGSGLTSYIQTGGTVIVRGSAEEPSERDDASALFSIPDPNGVFRMTGGTLTLRDVSGNNNRGIDIRSAQGNFNVTGGTLAVDIAGGSTFTLSSTANFWDVNITRRTGTNSATVTLGNALQVSGNLTIADNTQLNTSLSNFNVSIAGNLTLGSTTSSNASYIAGSNTTSFTGVNNSTITIANTTSVNPFTVANLILNKESNAEVIFQSAGRTEPRIAQVSGNLTVTNAILEYGAFTISAAGNIVNQGTIGKTTSTGIIVLNGSGSTQQITSGTNSLFRDITFAYTGTSTVGLELLSDINVRRFFYNSSRIVDLKGFGLTVRAIGGLTNNATDYSETKMFRTTGLDSDKGLTLTFNITNTSTGAIILFPLGSNISGTNRYTPLAVHRNTGFTPGSTSGTLNVKGVATQHPATDPTKLTDALNHYWVINSSGFAGLDGRAIDLVYTYYASIDNNHNPWRLIGNNWSSTGKNSDIDSKATASTITYPSAGLATGDYTTGKQSPFRNPTIFYSRQDGSFNVAGTWATGSHTGTIASAAPQSYDMVVIGVNHQVTATAAIAVAGVQINAPAANATPPTLDLSTFANHNLRIVSGGGRLITSSSSVPGGDFGAFLQNDTAIVEFRGTASSLYDDSKFASYPNLHLTGTSIITMPNRAITVRRALRIGSSANTTRFNLATNSFTVSGDVIMTNASQMVFPAPTSGTAVANVTVLGNLNLNDGTANRIRVTDGGINLRHSLTVHGNITAGNSYLTLFFATSKTAVDLTFTGNNASVFSVSPTNSALHRLTINKASAATSVEILAPVTLGALTNETTKALNLTRGHLTLNHQSINIELSSGNGNFNIPSRSALIVRNGSVTTTGTGIGIMLDGLLRLEGASTNQINLANGSIEYSSSGDAIIEVAGGTLTVGAQIRRTASIDGGVLRWNQSSGSVLVGNAINGTLTNRSVFEVLNPGSNFTHTGGSFTIVRQHNENSVSALRLLPATYTLGAATTITIGNTNTPAAQSIAINSNIPLNNLTINGSSSNSVGARLLVNPLIINGTLTVNTNSTFDASNFDLTLRGNFINSGSYVTNGNTTYFDGNAQSITGATGFHHLVVTPATSLTLNTNTNLTVAGNLTVNRGSFNLNNNVVDARGNVHNIATITNDNGDGIRLSSSTVQQFMSGVGTFGTLTVQNTNGVVLREGCTPTVNNLLKLANGVLDIRANLLRLSLNATITDAAGSNAVNSFSNTRMIQTNTSFTDAGVVKVMPIVNSGGPTFTFVYPVGNAGKYTPVSVQLRSNANSTGSIRVIPANEVHLVATSPESALQYNWAVRGTGLSGAMATMTFHYLSGDVRGTETSYIPIRILPQAIDDNNINKYNDVTLVDEATRTIRFVDIGDISGDYTAGTVNAFPDRVLTYRSTGNGAWDSNIWQPAAPTGGPSGAIIIVEAGNTVTFTSNNRNAYRSTINGTLDVGTTLGHRLGEVTGTGTLRVASGDLPAGVYTNFFTCNGGSIEYTGNTNYVLSNIATTVRNLTISGSGTKEMPNNNFEICGNLNLNGGILQNINNRNIIVRGNITKQSTGNFRAGLGGIGTASVILQGSTAQTVSGSFTTDDYAFNNLVIDNPAGVTFLSGEKQVRGNITLQSGRLTTTTAALLRVLRVATLTQASEASFVSGPMAKEMTIGNSFTFPIGKGSTFRPADVNSVSATETWTAEYYTTNVRGNTRQFTAPIMHEVSTGESWRISTPGAPGSANARVNLSYGTNSGAQNPATLLVAVYDNGLNSWVSLGNASPSSAPSGRLYATTNVGFSERIFSLATGDANAPLPIVLKYFAAKPAGKEVEITWATASEINNDFFTVERSLDGQNFTELLRMPGAGNSTKELGYSATDRNPLQGRSYYRLKQTDFDGSFAYSPVQTVFMGSSNDMKLSIFPNPADNETITLLATGLKGEKAQVIVTDITGRIISTQNAQLQNQAEEIELKNTSKLQSGIYIITLRTASSTLQQKLIIR